MPRISRAKASSRQHVSAVTLPSKRSFAVPDEAVREVVLPGSATDVPIKEALRAEASSSKSKRGGRSAADLVPLLSLHPYSRSHTKREKRKARQNLHGGEMTSVASALSDVLGLPELAPGTQDNKAIFKMRTKEEREAERLKLEQEKREKGKIGLGKGKTLREKARRAEISSQAKRIPAVMKHPSFKADPWATIREHAGNSIAVKDAAQPQKNLRLDRMEGVE